MRNFRIITTKLSRTFGVTPTNSTLISQRLQSPQFLGILEPQLNRQFTSQAQEPVRKPSEKLSLIVDEISGLTLLEVADLTEVLRKEMGVKEMPMVSLMMPGMGFSLRGPGGPGRGGTGAAGQAAEVKKEEKTAFDLKLEAGFDTAAKIKIIKEVRTFTDFGLKEAKDLVEKAPTVLKTGVPKEEAEKIIEKMKTIGAKVVME